MRSALVSSVCPSSVLRLPAEHLVLEVPEGRHTLKEMLYIRRPNLILRGAGGSKKTTFVAPKSEQRQAAAAALLPPACCLVLVAAARAARQRQQMSSGRAEA